MQMNENTGERVRLRMRARRLLRLRGCVGGAARISLGGAEACAVWDNGALTPNESKSAASSRERTADETKRERGRTREQSPLLCTELPFTVYGAMDGVARQAVLCVFSVLPEGVRREIEGALRALGREIDALEEIRFSLYTKSSIVLMGQERALDICLTKEDFSFVVRGVCHGTPFSYRTELSEGYLPFGHGVRVGAVGEAHYDESRSLVGISDIHTLIFRIPHEAPSGIAVERLRCFLSQNMRRGCLILGAPGEGKTTLLRALSRAFCMGEGACRVAVVDTRREFSARDGEGALMDILMGYRRTEGAAIALRTLSPGYIAMDEVGAPEDVDAIRSILAAGVPILATAHARDVRDAHARRYLRNLFEDGAFDFVLEMHRGRDGIRLSLYRL